jgi:hypothetical protein
MMMIGVTEIMRMMMRVVMMVMRMSVMTTSVVGLARVTSHPADQSDAGSGEVAP